MNNSIEYQILKEFELEKVGSDGWKVTRFIGFDAENIEIPAEIDGKKIIAIGDGIFKEDKKLKNVKISEGIKNIGDEAFFECTRAVSIILPDSLETVGERAFSKTSIDDIYFGKGIKSIGAYVCKECFRLRRVVFSDHIAEIPEMAFRHCRNLENVVLPKGIRTIGKNAFSLCGIKHIDLPEGLERIEDDAFSVTHLETLIIPKSMKYIGKDAISCGTTLKTIVILPGCEVELDNGFLHQDRGIGPLTDVYIPSSVTKIGKLFNAVESNLIQKFKKDEDGRIIRDAWGKEVIEDSLISGESERIPRNLTIYCEAGSEIMKFAKAKKVKCAEYNAGLAANLENIKKEAAKKYEMIKRAFSYAPGDTLYLSDEALAKEKFITDERGITIAPNIKIIKKYGGEFAKRSKAYFSDDSSLEIIENGAFCDCFHHTDYSFEHKALYLPPSVKLIEKGAFGSRCELKKVYVPASCKVEEGAFPEECKVIMKNSQNSSQGSDDTLESLSKLASTALEKAKGFWNKFKK